MTKFGVGDIIKEAKQEKAYEFVITAIASDRYYAQAADGQNLVEGQFLFFKDEDDFIFVDELQEIARRIKNEIDGEV